MVRGAGVGGDAAELGPRAGVAETFFALSRKIFAATRVPIPSLRPKLVYSTTEKV